MKIASIGLLTRTYMIALALVALLSTAAYFTMHQLTLTQNNSAKIINVSGRQRMLSQKAALYSIKLTAGKNTASQQKYRRELTNVLLLMEKSHDSLIHSNSELNMLKNPSTSISKIYFDQPVQLNAQVENYQREIVSLMSSNSRELNTDNIHLKRIQSMAPKLLASLNLAVKQYQLESESNVDRLHKVENGVLTLTLIVLLLEALFIYRPMAKRIKRETGQLKQANLRLKQLSSIDGLTQIANRRIFDEFIERQWRHSLREGNPLSLVMIDIDFFKEYNDHYGHQIGDDCLKKVAKALQKTINRPGDIVARYGGEEFVVLLSDTDINGALQVAETLKQRVEELTIIHTKSKISDFLTISLGVASILPSRKSETDNLINAADAALYKAKKLGRNRIAVSGFDDVALNEINIST